MKRAIALAVACGAVACAPPRMVAPLHYGATLPSLDAPFRRSPPPMPPVVDVPDAAPRETVLPNGLRVVVVERHGYPAVASVLLVNRGALDLGDRASHRVAQMMYLYGRGGSDAAAHDSGAAAVAGTRHGSLTTPGALYFWSAAPSSGLAESLGTLARSTVRAHLSRAEYTERGRWWSESAKDARLTLPAAQAVVLLGDDPLYGYPPPSPDVASFEATQALHDTLVRPNLAVLVIVGDVTPEAADAAVVASFGGGPAVAPEPPSHRSLPRRRMGARLGIIPRYGLEQRIASVFARIPLTPVRDREAVHILASLVARVGGRLASEVRGELGATYGVAPAFTEEGPVGWLSFDAAYDSGKAVDGVGALLDTIDRLRAGQIDDTDLAVAREVSVAKWREGFATMSGAAMDYAGAIARGEPLETVSAYPAHLASIGRDDIVRVANEYFGPDRLHVLFVGDDAWLDTAPLRMGGLAPVVMPR